MNTTIIVVSIFILVFWAFLGATAFANSVDLEEASIKKVLIGGPLIWLAFFVYSSEKFLGRMLR